jgi:hypothetical protein
MKQIVFAVLLAAVVGCGAAPQPGASTVGRITYTVSGGIAGWQRILTIEPDGMAQIQVVRGPSPGTTQQQVDATVLKRLHDLVRDPAFGALQREYLPTPGGADMQDYVVTVEIDGNIKQTSTRDGAQPPQILRDVLGILNQILAAASTR